MLRLEPITARFLFDIGSRFGSSLIGSEAITTASSSGASLVSISWCVFPIISSALLLWVSPSSRAYSSLVL